ncbi:MAG: DNA polymerase I [bacterium]
MPDEKKKILLIDTFGLLYRFYYILPKMKTADGAPTSAIYGLTRVLIKLANEMKPDYIAVVMESKSQTFRHKEFEAYKAHRDRMPDDLRSQLPIVDELLDAIGIATARVEGFEADDVIGTLAKLGSESGLDVGVITGDKDLLQLVDDNVCVMMSKKGVTDMDSYDRERVKETMGVYPENIPDKKGLEGDSSDNIPGVPGVGPKTAAILLEKYVTIEKLYESLDEIDKKPLREKLETNRELAALSKRLATIVRDVPMESGFERFRRPALDPAALEPFLKKYEFTTILKEINKAIKAASPVDEPAGTVGEQLESKFRAVFTESEIVKLLDRARAAKRLCIDVETEGLDPFNDRIVGYALAVDPGDAMYVPVRHRTGAAAEQGDMFGPATGEKSAADAKDDEKQLPAARVMELLRPVLDDPEIGKWGHNLKFDLLMLRNEGGPGAGALVENVGYDSILAAYLADPELRRYALKPLAENMLGAKFRTYEDMVGKGKTQKKFSEVPIEDAIDYACADVDAVLRIETALTERLRENGLERVFSEMEIPLVPVLAEMEWNGIAIDKKVLANLSDQFTLRENAIRQEIRQLTGKELNLNSPKQVAELLFDTLGLRKVRKDSTDIAALEQLAGDHTAVPLLIEYRHLSKLRGTYVDALPKLENTRTGRIHTTFNQTLTATGRLSSSDPNLQNIPVRSEEGREIRRAFVPGDSSNILISADYSQIEIRLLAELSEDPILMDTFNKGEDVHTRTAAEVFGVSLDEVSKDQRRYAKTINFGLIYGMREFRLSQQLGISRHEAADFIEKYFARYPKVREFIETTKAQIVSDGYITTMFGRKRTVDDVKSANKMEQEAGLRAAFNTRLQGTAADIMKMAMIRVYKKTRAAELDAKLLLQVHDELVFEAAKDKVAEVAAIVREAMESAGEGWVDFKVKLVADVKAGPNWLDMEAI